MENLNIEAGKRYILRNGTQTNSLTLSTNGTNYCFEDFLKEKGYKEKSCFNWKKNGRYLTNSIDHEKDIIREL
jgi:hypothetical protein